MLQGAELYQWRDRFVEYHQARSSTQYWKRLHTELTRLIRWLGEKPLTKANLRDYETFLALHGKRRHGGEGCLPSTLDAYKITWHSWSVFIADSLDDPSLEVRLKPHKSHEREAQNRRVLTEAEAENIKFVARANPVWHDLFMTYALTGVRANEGLRLLYPDLSGNVLTIRAEVAKGRKERFVASTKALREIWERNRDGDCLRHLMGMTYKKLEGVLHKLSDRARIPEFGPHAIRHYWATKLLSEGVPVKTVSEMLGHSSIATTEKIYCHFTKTHIEGACDCLESA